MGHGAGRGMSGADRFTVEGIEFVPGWDRPSEPGSLTLLKSPAMVPLYRDLLAPYPNPRMVELGISQGGSVALLALLARPSRFVALELDPTPIGPLATALQDLGLADRVRPHYGVDQGDRATVAAIVAAEFGDSRLDVVVDDASHHYDPTVASFEVLFPRLRPGGVYVIEDWTWQDLVSDNLPDLFADESSDQHAEHMARLAELLADREVVVEPPMSRLALELSLSVIRAGGAVAKVTVDENWIVVHRGEAELDPTTFRFGQLYQDHYGQLAPHQSS